MNLPPRPTRLIFFNPWADELEETAAYLARLPSLDLTARLADPADERLRRMARLDADWYGECARCFAAIAHPALACAPAWITGIAGLATLAARCAQRPLRETWWLIFTGHHPQKVGAPLAPLCAYLRKRGVRIAFYAFDEVSRQMPCFNDLAPHLDVFIHDESPLAETGAARLRPQCVTRHRSWVANIVPFASPFNEEPEAKILFLGSQLGLTPHRERQIAFLRKKFKDKFVASHDHSVAVADRFSLSRYRVGLCPEGRKFTTPAMSATHTDRPFWSGCLGLVPVSEDSAAGGRLQELHEAKLLVRYAHSDLGQLAEACERALAMPDAERRKIYEHFNRQETVGAVVADMMVAAGIEQRIEAVG
jgi:hypothetical protein